MPSYLDLGLLAVVLISALLAMLRGFTREVLAIASWGAAAIAAIYLHPLLVPYIKPYIAKDVIAMAAAAGIVFFITLVVVSLVTVRLSDAILDFEGRRARPLARFRLRRRAWAVALRRCFRLFRLARARQVAT